jgi:Flp pilus assembly protein CpaB
MIPTGMRAASVRVNDVAGVAGFVLPGMRVDVLVTGKPPGSRRHVHRHGAAECDGALRRPDRTRPTARASP